MPAIIDNAGNNRGACFDGKHVFVASRQNGNHIYYWTLGDSTGTPAELDLNGVTGGTFVLSDLAFTKDHLFLSNMVFVGGVFKVYAWKDRNSPPKILLEYPMAPARLGDAITVVGDPNTSAKLIASGHGTKNIYIWNIVNGTIPNTQPTIVPFDVVTNVNFARIQQVSDPATPYLISGPTAGIILLDSTFQISLQIPPAFFPSWPMSAQTFSFLGKRYLTYVHVKSNPAENARYVLDITDGNTIREALQSLSQAVFADRLVYQSSLGDVSNGNASVGAGLSNDAFGNVLCMSYAAGNGFILQRFGETTSGFDAPIFKKQSVLFPNPTDGEWIIKHPGNVEAIHLLDLQGRVVQSWLGQSQEIRCSVNDVLPGIYLVQVISQGKMEFHKLMITDSR